VTTSLGQRWASGCLGIARKLLIDLIEQRRDKIYRVMRLSSQGKDVT